MCPILQTAQYRSIHVNFKRFPTRWLFLTLTSCGYCDICCAHQSFRVLKYDIISSDGVVNTCSMSCAEADWESSHLLLCTGESSDPARREALLKFIKHANGKTPIGVNNFKHSKFVLILFSFFFLFLLIYIFPFSTRNK